MKVRIILKAKKDLEYIKKDQTMTFINEIFDVMNGIAFYPIDREQWDVIGYDLSTRKIDQDGKEIFGNDFIKGKYQFERSNEYPIMLVEWNEDVGFELREINGGKYTCPINRIEESKFIGNSYENILSEMLYNQL